MSLFSTIETDCPACGVTASYELVFSVNADRRPELRTDIMDRSFQRLTCPTCAEAFRIEPQFTYVHLAGHAFIMAWPSTDVEQWPARVARSEQAFDRLWGSGAEPAAAAIGKELVRRVTFGWEAVHEKLLAADAGIDDVTLELAKLALLRTQGDVPVEDVALRLVQADETSLTIAMVEVPNEHVHEHFVVPRTLLAEIEADAEGWAALRDQLTETSFVDIQRLLTVPAEA